MPELERIPERHPFLVPLVGAFPWDRNPDRSIEFELLRDDLVRFSRHRAAQNTLRNVLRNVLDGIGDGELGTQVLILRLCLLVKLPATMPDLFFGEREVLLRDGFIVMKAADFCRKEFPPFPRLLHVTDDLRYQHLVLFLRVFFVENAGAGMLQGHGSEAMGAGAAFRRVEDVAR